MKKVLVLGATGMAGHTISLYLMSQGHDVIGFARQSCSMFDCIEGDALQINDVNDAILKNRFDIVVNAIGVLNRNADSKPDEAIFLNAFLPHHLARITEKSDTRVFHMSTDCVFAGNTGPYTEKSIPDGKTLYDKTKALGELVDQKNLTLRNSIVGPDLKPEGIGLLNWFMQQTGVVKGFRKAIWTGVTTLELAKAITHMIEENVSGLVNMVPDESISKLDLLSLFNTYLACGSKCIEPTDEVVVDKTLIRKNFESTFRPKGYKEQILDLAEWMQRHKGLYPHYGM